MPMSGKKFEQEAHYDDCGSDFEPLMENEHRAMLSMERHQVTSIVDYAYFDVELRYAKTCGTRVGVETRFLRRCATSE